MRLALIAAFTCGLAASAAYAAGSDPILAKIDPKGSLPLSPVAADHAFGECHFRTAANGAPLPDPKCTPGAVNPTLTIEVLTDPNFRTGLVRDQATSETVKRKVYGWYGLVPPKNNTGQNQTCEGDHLIDLGSGGADTLANYWPQCQRASDPQVPVGKRWFKIKDANAEHQMIAALKSGLTDAHLADLQKRIADDWTQMNKPTAQ